MDAERNEHHWLDVLVDYVQDLVDAGVKTTVPKSRLASLAFLNKVAGLRPVLPVDDIAVTAVASAHRRDGPRTRRGARAYTVDQVRIIEAAATSPTSALSRVVLRTELRKIFAALRNDDAIWDTPQQWRFAGGEEGFMYGESYKTKSTEATSTRLASCMPWVAPARGVSAVPSHWTRGYIEDLRAVGVESTAEYAVPCPHNVRAGRRPPGAAQPDTWQVQLRHSLREAGFTPPAAAAITLHSAKKTILTWAGCSGKFTDREIEVLGHHRSSGVSKTVRAYNVTELSAPAHKLSGLLWQIAEGTFQPDQPPGLQWIEPSRRKAAGMSSSSIEDSAQATAPKTSGGSHVCMVAAGTFAWF